MEDDIRKLMMLDIAFHRTPTRLTPLKLVPNPLGITTTIYQAYGAMSSPPLKDAYMVVMTFSQFPRLGYSFRFLRNATS